MRIAGHVRSLFLAFLFLCTLRLAASEYHGQVLFHELPVPGATVTATQNGKTVSTITDPQGFFAFADLDDGIWNIEVSMLGFVSQQQKLDIGPGAAASKWELKLLSLDQIKARLQNQNQLASAPVPDRRKESDAQSSQAPSGAALPQPSSEAAEDELTESASDGLLINGSVNNAAASPFAQFAAFGNNRSGRRGLYTGGMGLIYDNSVFDARPFSLTGQATPKAAYNRVTGVLSFGGPIEIPHVVRHGPNFFLNYQWTRNRVDTVSTALMPDLAERSGLFSGQIIDPANGLPFLNNTIPQNRISAQAQALLNLYPLPNVNSNSRYNYETSTISETHQDALQSRFDKTLNGKNQAYGRFAFQNTRSSAPNVFKFLDTTDLLGIDAAANWSYRFQQRSFLNLGYQFSRLSTRVKPFFENRENISAHAGISGNNQAPANWGPPTLNFSSGIASLADAQSSFDRTETNGISCSVLLNHTKHNFFLGMDFRRQEFNYLSQQDPRGTFAFTGAVTGLDFADFLLGIPDTSSIAFGNADKYFRESVYDAYFTDDWRISPELTANLGVRWEYGAPITELYNRMVNLDVAPGFTAAAPVLAGDPVGSITGAEYPNSLLRPDKHAFEPRLGVAWRPIPSSSMVIRAGYGVYYDSSVYQTLALEMAQQPPLSKTFSIQNSAMSPLTMANGFNASAPAVSNTFAIDPKFQPGYAQVWQLGMQRDLPASLQMRATYLGTKGSRGAQQFLPNTYPIGAVSPCSACPSGFAYLSSTGSSTRQSGQLQLRRRLHNGFTALFEYTYSKSIDDDSGLGGQGPAITTQITAQNSGSSVSRINLAPPAASANLSLAQDWLNLRGERGLSTFDQRHLVNLQFQYTTGMGLKGGTLLSGWKGGLFKQWTVAGQISAGSGLPQTPVYFAAVPGTGITGTIRPDYTGAPLYRAPAGSFLNPAAYAAPQPGQWGNAGRNSITGPTQFSLNASVGRAFRLSDRYNLDFRIDAINALNHVNYTAWNTVINGAQFGLPAAASPMRSVQTNLRVRF